MINILEILKKIPNLEDMVFYSPLYGDVKVRISSNYECPIEIYSLDVIIGEYFDTTYLTNLTREGYYDNIAFGEREIMLYPSRQNRDWSTFKVPRKDLPRDTSVMVSRDNKTWRLRKYAEDSNCYSILDDLTHVDWNYIIPVDKFNFKDWSFKEEDNYGTAHKELLN